LRQTVEQLSTESARFKQWPAFMKGAGLTTSMVLVVNVYGAERPGLQH